MIGLFLGCRFSILGGAAYVIAYADIMWLARGHVEVLLFKISNKAQLALSQMMEIGFLSRPVERHFCHISLALLLLDCS